VGYPSDAPGIQNGWALGIDEAGRGSVVGPLVVGGFLIPADRAGSLPELDVRDSKLLSPARRRAAYDRIGRVGRRYHVTLTPAEIDAAVRVGGLNELEARAFGRLVREARPEVAYVDACDPVAERFGRTVATFAGIPTRIVSQHRADRDLPVVGAASIVAKVLRDRAISRLHARLGTELGSGYPSDRRTRAFVADTLRRGERPGWLRASWRTTQDLLPSPSPRRLETFA
jgi:ribonuclease HII